MRLSLRAAFGFALLTLAFLLTFLHPAFAQDVYVDAGSWVDQFAPYITLALYIILLGVVLFVVSRLPLADGTKALIQSLVLKYAQEWGLQLINAAVQRVKDATHGKVITVNVGNAVLASAVQGFVDQVPGFVIKFLGGKEGVAKFLAGLFQKADVQIPDGEALDVTKAASSAVPPQ